MVPENMNTTKKHRRRIPRYQQYWNRFIRARDVESLTPAVQDLTIRLLRCGLSAADIASGLTQIANIHGLGDAVAPIVHEVAALGEV